MPAAASPCLGRLFARMPQQARLADSRLALHQQRRPRTRACRLDRGRDRAEIRRPVEQPACGHTAGPHGGDGTHERARVLSRNSCQITVVPAVMRHWPGWADRSGVSGPTRLVVTAEITVTGEQVQGTVRGAGCPAQAFSGWSELFAVLLALISAARGEGTAPGRHPPAPTDKPD